MHSSSPQMCTGRRRPPTGPLKEFVVDQTCWPGALDFSISSSFATAPVEAPARSREQNEGACDEPWSYGPAYKIGALSMPSKKTGHQRSQTYQPKQGKNSGSLGQLPVVGAWIHLAACALRVT